MICDLCGGNISSGGGCDLCGVGKVIGPPPQHWNLRQEDIDAIAKQVIEGLIEASRKLGSIRNALLAEGLNGDGKAAN